ncbi:hypothetical protein JCM3775_001142 [Rhodotorula graminis]
MAAVPLFPRHKPPRVMLDNLNGPAPNPGASFWSADQFKQMYRAYQWTQGFDVEVTHDEPGRVVLACATHRTTCPFSITATMIVFTQREFAGEAGWFLAPDEFRPAHNHLAPFVPLDIGVENARLARLQHGDPAIEMPPLVRAASASAGARVPHAAGSSVGAGAAGPGAPSLVSRALSRASSSGIRPELEQQAPPTPGPPRSASPDFDFFLPTIAAAPPRRAAQPVDERSAEVRSLSPLPSPSPRELPPQPHPSALRSNPFR